VSTIWVASYVMLWIIVALLAVVVMGTLRQLGIIQLRFGSDPGALITPEGLDRGTEAPRFEGVDVRTQQRIHLDALRGRPSVLVFLSPGCSTCGELVPHLNDLARDRQGEINVLAVCAADETTSREFAQQVKLRTPMLADPTNAIGASYGVQHTPFAFLLDPSATILIRGVINTWPQLDALLQEEGTLQSRKWQPSPTLPKAGVILTSNGAKENAVARHSGNAPMSVTDHEEDYNHV